MQPAFSRHNFTAIDSLPHGHPTTAMRGESKHDTTTETYDNNNNDDNHTDSSPYQLRTWDCKLLRNLFQRNKPPPPGNNNCTRQFRTTEYLLDLGHTWVWALVLQAT
eukprot:m.230393 g.230393  ORF g.230393 m.230393 type:complete len:107 (+) comp26456_c5_seq2:3594-3914(+)